MRAISQIDCVNIDFAYINRPRKTWDHDQWSSNSDKTCEWLAKLFLALSLLLSFCNAHWATAADTVKTLAAWPTSDPQLDSGPNFGPSSRPNNASRRIMLCAIILMIISIIMAAFRLPTGQSTVAPRPPPHEQAAVVGLRLWRDLSANK